MEKRNIKGLVVFVFVLFATISCGKTRLYNHSALSEPNAESATVHILRPDSFASKWIGLPVTFNGVKLLEIKNATYTTVYIKPGSYSAKLDFKHKNQQSGEVGGVTFDAVPAQIELVAGKTYYLMVKAHLYDGAPMMYTDMHFTHTAELLSQDEGEMLIKQLEYIEVN